MGTVLRRALAPVGLAALGATVAAAASAYGLRRQAAAARVVIGKPFGEEAFVADKVYKRKYGDDVELLLLGDSIAAGLGADSPKQTLGAELARRVARATHRSVRLHTAAVVGAESSDLAGQLDGLPAGYRPDVAVIVVGGNDVIHRVRPADSRRHLAAAVGRLRAAGVEVVVGTCPDLGALRALRQPLRGLGSRASRQLAAVQREATTEAGGRAVALAEVVGPFFLARPDEMFSLDRFHPSGAGYRRTAKAIAPSVLLALGHGDTVPFGL